MQSKRRNQRSKCYILLIALLHRNRTVVNVVVMKQVLRYCCIDDGKCDEEGALAKGPHRIKD